MRIGFVTTEFLTEPYFSGGLANYVYRVAKNLAERGHDVHVFVQGTTSEAKIISDKFIVHRIIINSRPRWAKHLFRNAFYELGRRLRFAYKVWREVENIHQLTPFDIIQVPNHRFPGIFLATLGSPVIVTRLSSYGPAWRQQKGCPQTFLTIVYDALERFQIRNSPYVFAPSQLIASMVGDALKRSDISVIPSPFYLEVTISKNSMFQLPWKPDNYLLFVGRLEMHKGIKILMRAIPEFLNTYPEAAVLIVGKDGLDQAGESVRQTIQTELSSYRERVIFMEPQPHERLYPLMKHARLLAVPSLIDNLPNVMLEAMAMGTPVVGTYGTSIDEVVVNGINGFLVPPGNVDSLGRVLREAWNRQDLVDLAESARKTADRFSPNNTVTALLEYYSRALSSRKKK
jgi:glycosyltransferase involved in cell wall biosynthesis